MLATQIGKASFGRALRDRILDGRDEKRRQDARALLVALLITRATTFGGDSQHAAPAELFTRQEPGGAADRRPEMGP